MYCRTGLVLLAGAGPIPGAGVATAVTTVADCVGTGVAFRTSTGLCAT